MDRVGSFWRLLLISSVIWIHSSLSRSVDVPRYETAYACEGKTLKIECADGERIHLIRANYGRFSITICNDHGNTDWSVNCMSHKSLRVLHTRCEMALNCSIDVSNHQFQDDPCPGTQKYVEAHYICVASTTTTTNRPSPPWLITSQPPSVWSTPTARPPTGPPLLSETSSDSGSYRTTSSQNVSSVNIPQFNIVTPAPLPPLDFDSVKPETSGNEESTEDVDLSNIPPSSPTTVLFSTFGRNSPGNMTETPLNEYVPSPSIPWFQENDSCSPVTVRNLNWNWTRIGDKVIQPCPGGATGLARWRCVAGAGRDHDPTWFPDTPDLSECRSVWLTSLESRIIEGDSLIAITSDLAMVTSSKTLYGGDMMITTKIIMKMAQKMANDIQSFPDPRQREAIVSELLSGVVRTGSNLLDWSQHPSWRDLGYKEQMQVATSLLIGLEENAFLLADTVIREKTVVQTVRNIMLSVRVLETYNIGTETFPSPGSATDQWSVSNDWVQLPRSALRENSEGGLVRLVFVAFDRLEEILQWNPESYDHGSGHNVSRVLNSKVISASLGKGRHIQLSEPIRLMLRHIKTENVSNPSCVFWDYTMSAWSEEGCRVESTNRTHTMCLCDHLTNFAILMDVHMTYLPPGHQMALQIITYIGCIISIICLILAIITFHLFRGLKSDRTTIHKNLCFCLLVAEILFIVGINQTEHALLCGVVAGLLHFFFLCAFAWMFLEGFQLYVLLVEVFEAEKSRARWYYLVAYGTPLLVVIGSAVADPHSYGTDKSCWLRADNFFIFTFVGPVILVILANLIFLSMAIFIMCRHANASISMKSKEHSRLASARVWLRGAIVLVFLLGLTWTFGLLYLNEETVIMAYIFTILNSLQGLFIFMFHCVQNEKVRKEYRKLIRRHSWLPRCLPCSKPNGSSGTSGSNSRGGGSGGSGSGSGGLCKERRGSLYAATSNGNAASTDSSALSPHTASQYSLQRNWSSRSCNTIGHIGVGKNNSLTTTTNNYNTSSRLHNFHHDHNDTSPQTQQQIQPCIVPDAQSAAVLNSNIDTATATLPYIRNQKRTTTNVNSLSSNSPAEDTDESNMNPVFPKSATTWRPLNKPLQWKNISFKSYSRDSGHGGSEQEDSPRSYNTSAVGPCSPVGNLQQRLSNVKDSHRKPFMAADFHQCNNLSEPKQFVDYLHGAAESLAHQQQLAELSQQIQQLPQNTRYNHLHQHSLGGRKKQNGGTFRTGTVNPRNHTYTEIHDACRMAQAHAHAANLGGGFYHGAGEDPVYEEIDRNEMQVSDMSDEDGRRQSDMSRQSSRSYGDHRPLIPSYSPAAERSLIEDRDRMCTVAGGGREQHAAVQGRRHNAYGGEHARSLAAVLDGETVVCHLEPPDLYPSSRTMVLPPYTEC